MATEASQATADAGMSPEVALDEAEQATIEQVRRLFRAKRSSKAWGTTIIEISWKAGSPETVKVKDELVCKILKR